MIALRQTGTGSMGDVTDPESVCRFRLDDPLWEVVRIRGKATKLTGSGGKADLSIKLDHRDRSGLCDFLLCKVLNFGVEVTDAEPNFDVRIREDEREHWRFSREPAGSDELVLEWTNPDSGNIRWEVEVCLKPV